MLPVVVQTTADHRAVDINGGVLVLKNRVHPELKACYPGEPNGIIGATKAGGSGHVSATNTVNFVTQWYITESFLWIYDGR